ncbi:17431_t:CDS:2, partial [Gigaspora margarita]
IQESQTHIMFHDWSSIINGVDISNDRQYNIMNPKSTYDELLANTMLPKWNNMVNGVDTLYKNNQFEFDLGNQNENNFVVNSEVYQKEFQTDATFCEWDYVDDRLDTLILNMTLLQVGMVFLDWNHAMSEIKKYEKRQGFKTRLYCIEKLKNSDIQRRTIVCEHFGQPETTKSKDPKKEITTKQIGYM